MSGDNRLRANAERIDALLGELSAEPRARRTAEALVRVLMESYGGGLKRMLEIAGTEAPAEVFERLCRDETIAHLLILHGLHPWTIERRIEHALERVRPHLGSHGGDVVLIAIEEGVVTLRLEGSCDGCPASALTMKRAIEKALEAAAPEIVEIRLEESEAKPSAEPPRYQECPETIGA